jgi:hypothetical protein
MTALTEMLLSSVIVVLPKTRVSRNVNAILLTISCHFPSCKKKKILDKYVRCLRSTIELQTITIYFTSVGVVVLLICG